MSTRELMTLPKADKLLLIIPASLSLSPTALVYLDLSLPAKSIIWNLDVLMFQTPPSFIDFDSMIVVRTEWDRELSLFRA